jgi:preprotein translocase subunit SecF
MSTVAPDTPAVRQRSLWGRLYHGETTFDFVGRSRIAIGVSVLIIVVSALFIGFRGLNLGIDFEGGVSWEVASSNLSNGQIESILTANGIEVGDSKIEFLKSRAGTSDRVRIQVPEQPETVRDAVRQQLADAAGVPNDEVTKNEVSATWGKEITRKAITALIVFVILLSVYISWRFEWKMAVAAIVAMLHDVAISVGVYAILNLTVAPATVIAFLTILGFSLYDTIVVFDKVHENARRFGTSRVGYGDIVNLSSNEVLMRSLNTSLAALLPVASVLVVGAAIMGVEVLVDFSLALLVGLATGSYSSLFIATPILVGLKGREKKWAATRHRHASGEELARLRVSGAAAIASTRAQSRSQAPADGVDAAPPVATDAATVLSHPPRPRKKRRR